jgi:hypothetical protein
MKSREEIERRLESAIKMHKIIHNAALKDEINQNLIELCMRAAVEIKILRWVLKSLDK